MTISGRTPGANKQHLGANKLHSGLICTINCIDLGHSKLLLFYPWVQSPKPKSDIQSPKCAYAYTWGGGVTGLGLSPKFYFLGGFPFKSKQSYRDVYREAVSLYREEAVSV